MADMIISIVEWILEFIASAFGSMCQFFAGIIFDSMDLLIGSNQNVVINVLSPVYNFSVNYLVPFALSLMGVLVVWNFLLTMFGKYSASNDDPIRLMVRSIIFGVLIGISTSLIGFIGGTTTTTNGKSESGIVLQLTSAMANIGTSNDSLGEDGLTSNKYSNKKNVSSEVKKTLDNGFDNVQKFTGYTTEKDDSNGDVTEYNVNPINSKKSTLGTAITGVGVAGTMGAVGGFAAFFSVLVIYVLIYCVMILVMAWKCLRVCSRFVYRFVIFLVLLYMAPLMFACGPSKSTQRIFSEWLKMIASYAVLLVTTAGFMRVAIFVIYQSFHYAGSVDLMNNVFAFLVAIMFLKMIYELERYIEKLSLNAVGLPDSVSGLSKSAEGIVNAARFALMREGMKKAMNLPGDLRTRPDMSVKTPDTITDKPINEAFGQGIKEFNTEGNEVNLLAAEMMEKNDNDNAFISDANGESVRGTDGLMHNADEFREDENGNMVLKSNPNVMAEDQSMKDRYSISDTGIISEGVEGLDETTGAFSNVSETSEDSMVIPNEKGNLFMSESADGNVIVKKSDLDSSNTTNYALKNDGNGNFSAVKWTSESDGDKYRLSKGGNLVNIGNGQSYSFAKQESDGATAIKYTISSDGKKVINAKTNRVETQVKYNNNLPNNARISSINNLDYCSTLYDAVDGTKTGIARQMLIDEKTGKPNGKSRYVKFTLYENNEINRDAISRHSRMSKGNPCEGYTPDGKSYIHIEKYMGERKQSTIQKYRAS